MKEKKGEITADAVKKSRLFLDLNVRHHEKSCHTCRYFRVHGDSNYCLFIGRKMVTSDSATGLLNWAKSTICDIWKKRPSTWSSIAIEDPFWLDRYIPRKTQKRYRA